HQKRDQHLPQRKLRPHDQQRHDVERAVEQAIAHPTKGGDKRIKRPRLPSRGLFVSVAVFLKAAVRTDSRYSANLQVTLRVDVEVQRAEVDSIRAAEVVERGGAVRRAAGPSA